MPYIVKKKKMHPGKYAFPSDTAIKRYQRVASSHHLFLFLHSLLHLHLSLPLPHHTVKATLSTLPKDLHCTKFNGPVSVLQFLTSPCCLALLMLTLLSLASAPLSSVLQFAYSSLYSLPACSLMAPPQSLQT